MYYISIMIFQSERGRCSMKKNSPKRKLGSLHPCFFFLDHPDNCQITTNRSRQRKTLQKYLFVPAQIRHNAFIFSDSSNNLAKTTKVITFRVVP